MAETDTPASTVFQAARMALRSIREVPSWHALVWGALAAFAVLATVVGLGIGGLIETSVVNDPSRGWIDMILDVGGSMVLLIAAWFAFPSLTLLVVSLFLETIAANVESRYYPPLPAHEVGWHQGVIASVRLMLKALGLNFLALPLYFVPIVNVAVYALVNGYLLGREYFELVALRHLPLKEATALRKRHARTVLGAGILIALSLTVPIFNLFAAVLGAHLMVHLFRELVAPSKIEAQSQPT